MNVYNLLTINNLNYNTILAPSLKHDNYMTSLVSLLCSAFFNFLKVSNVLSDIEQQIITKYTYIHTYIPSSVPGAYCPELLTEGTDLTDVLTTFCKK